jgi:alpha-glucoside transport system permease protein
LTIDIGVGGCITYFSNQFLDKVLYPAKGDNPAATSIALI